MQRQRQGPDAPASGAARKAHSRVFLEELGLVAFLGGVLLFGAYLLFGSFGVSESGEENGQVADADAAAESQPERGEDATGTRTAQATDDTASSTSPETVEPPASGTASGEPPAADAGEDDPAGLETTPLPEDDSTAIAQAPETPANDEVDASAAEESNQAEQTGGGDAAEPAASTESDTRASASEQQQADTGDGTQAATGGDDPPDTATTGKAESSSAPDTSDQTTDESTPAESAPSSTESSEPSTDDESTNQNGDGADGSGTVAEDTGEDDSPPPAPPIEIADATFTYDVTSSRPQGRVTYVDYGQTQAGRLYFYTRVDAPQGTRLVHEWRYQGEVVERASFRVQGSNETSVSHYFIPEGSRGVWRVYVRDANGEVIKVNTALYE